MTTMSRRRRTHHLVFPWLLAGGAALVCAIGLQAQRPAAPSAAPSTPAAGSRAAKPTTRTRAFTASGRLPLKAVGSVQQIMATLIDPNADAVWESVGTIIDERGTEERRPRTGAEWNAVAASALALAESGNLLMLEGRAKDRDAWLRMSRALVDAGETAWKAAQARDVQALMDAGEGVTIACDTCHGLYWKAGGSYSAAALRRGADAAAAIDQLPGDTQVVAARQGQIRRDVLLARIADGVWAGAGSTAPRGVGR